MEEHIDRALGDLLPHGEGLCLIDEVAAWDEQEIVCITRSHGRADNAYRVDGRLPWPLVIEYAAQAMALHAALRGDVGGTRVIGAVRNLRASQADLDDYVEPLRITARVKVAGQASAVYTFDIRCGGSPVATGATTLIGRLDTVEVPT